MTWLRKFDAGEPAKVFKYDVGVDVTVVNIGLGKVIYHRLDPNDRPLYTIKMRTGRTPDGMFLAREEELSAIKYLYNEDLVAWIIVEKLTRIEVERLIQLPDPEIALQAICQVFACKYPDEWAHIAELAREVA